MGLFEVLITNMKLICGINNIKMFIALSNLTLIKVKFLHQNLNVIVGITTSNNLIINNIYV